ncbi:serine/threonine protein kinase KIN2 KNAG_0G02110 [Huiozyma naganishii CBS 8797]|uniref:non-specific serine/threonine protein kinase n=1 Tax=Huiozyma naganishii (strain ATCC MYA-139 / BCRC 22969 / CBS 8797 / KCTC 17520 / NBRC 10181 / NCYC 3082 / Yp74L-3) TaxID=1071383 RepID=J7RNT6_HUIN7|nr:hypothetical protein KNAG_0G02110 [Kazachstania naganishii CBS 8797]CCK71268.1 hypothetical protein KNAG_0G02110 [Kazachstania naganishii CBS 8797]
MPETQDYYVNTQFTMGRTGMPTPVATPDAGRDAGAVGASAGAGVPPPLSPVAPATSRMMMGKKAPGQDALQKPFAGGATSPATGSPMKSPSQGSHSDPKQFHRRALGDWDFLETVGAGSMGKVKLAKHHHTNEICAIKIVNRATKAFLHKEQNLPPPKSEQEILQRQKRLEKEISRDKRTIREASLGQILYHPHICRLFEMCTMSNHFYMLFEYVSGGQLLDYIIQHGSLREHHARKFARGIGSALQYLHANNIVHRDLKIENIMISTSGEIKIIDFGLSNVYDPRKQLHTFCGSLYFAAPELLKARPYLGPEVDVWSFGVVLYVLVCGKVPFDDEVSSVLHEKIKQGNVEYPNHLSIEVLSLLSKMLVVDPERRASLKQVIEHPWMNRGYDYITPSYLPKRIPLTPDMLDQAVIKEMFRLEFIDNIEDTRGILTRIITEESYVELSRQYWENVANMKRSNPTGVFSSFDDPTRAYSPLLSIYYLISEMLARKLAKLQRRQQAQAQAMQQESRSQDSTQQPSERKSLQQAVQVQPGELAPETSPIAEKQAAPQHQQQPMPFKFVKGLQTPTSDKRPSNDTLMATGNLQTTTENTTATPSSHTTPVPFLKSPVRQGNYGGPERPLQVMVPPKLSIPEQAHTSPTSRKSSETHQTFDNVLSPVPTDISTQHQLQQAMSPRESQDSAASKAFGGIFRKLSQKHNSPPISSTNSYQKTAPQIAEQHTVGTPNLLIHNRGAIGTKSHARTVSEYVPASTRMGSYGSPVEPSPTIMPPMRSASQKQAKKTDLPALPSNAEALLQQQREREIERGVGNLDMNETTNATKATDQQDEGLDIGDTSMEENGPLPPLNVIKGRKFHPSARAKSVGHARRESLKFMRPPVPTATSNNYQEVNDWGFLENSDDNKSDNTGGLSAGNTNTSGNVVQTTTSNGSLVRTNSAALHNAMAAIPELTDEQILDEASKAPAGEMLSIDYPRSLFLKGFFSVQTTSSKPLPIVRYKIITTLRRMHIEFKEVKGGFICVQRQPNINLSNVESISENNSNRTSSSQYLKADNQRRNLSRHSSIRRQQSLKQGYPGIPNTPHSFAHHERNISLLASPLNENAHSSGLQDLSTASIEEFTSPDDILTTSKAQEMNEIDTNTETGDASREKTPIKFEIHIVKVRIVGLAGVHFKKVSGNTWLYKELASHILKELNL